MPAMVAIVDGVVTAKFFGTDGVRGEVGRYPIVPEFFSHLAGVVEEFFSQHMSKDRLKIAVGRDTRWSGEMLAMALALGFSSNATVLDCGILPTPAVAYAIRAFGCDCGFSITASHNPYVDNGVKIFNANGEKLSADLELAIDELLQRNVPPVRGELVAAITDCADLARNKFCAQFDVEDFTFTGRVVLDTANGAATFTSHKILHKFCRDLTAIGDNPDGRNINLNCGSEHIAALCESVRNTGARLGFAQDGDGDRLVVVDETGEPVDGDQLLGVIAGYLFQKKRLKNGLVVVTEQSNFGLDRSLNALGITVVRCDVGDRSVYQAMLKHGASFGGEESGHIIFREISNGGDAVAAAVLVLKIVGELGRPLSELKATIPLYPKKLCNINVMEKIPLHGIAGFGELLDFLRRSEPDYGRVFARYSGTENKLRVLVEARSNFAVDKILTSVRKFLESTISQ
jgi:phosphoglucosamine mutase